MRAYFNMRAHATSRQEKMKTELGLNPCMDGSKWERARWGEKALRPSAIFSSFHASETKLIYSLSCSAWRTQT